MLSTTTILCLAMNIYHEARSEGLRAQLAVAQVTMNRVAHASYPASVCDVVWQSGQFSWTEDGKSDTPRDERAWAVAQWVARMTLTDDADELRVVGKDVTHYHADYVQPYWSKIYTLTDKIGRHIFYIRAGDYS